MAQPVEIRDPITGLPLFTASNPGVVGGGGGASGTNPLPVSGGTAYKYIAASASNTLLGATGALGDYISGILVVPATTSPGAVSITDGNGGAMTLFAGGASSIATLHPFFVAFSGKSTNATTPGWRVTTGANLAAIAFGTFT